MKREWSKPDEVGHRQPRAEGYVRTRISPGRADRFHATPEIVAADLDEAYGRLLRATRGDARFGAAWKLGGTTPTTRAAFRVDKAYFGCLHESEVVHEPTAVAVAHLCELKGEVEIALRLSAAMADRTVADLRELQTAGPATGDPIVDAWCVALEMPASAIINLPEAGIAALVADRCAAGCLALGRPRALDDDGWSGRAALVLEQGGVVLARGDIGCLVASPYECVVDFCAEAVAHGFRPRPGQWIATGGLTPCVGLQPGRRVAVRHNGCIALDFELRD